MRIVYLLLVVLGLTKALPEELLAKLDVNNIKEILNKFKENDIEETLKKLYVDQFRDSVKIYDIDQLKEYVLDSNNQYTGPIETIILGLLERVRDVLVNGTESIPVLDPITIDRINIGDTILPPPSYITINDLTIKDISTFEVEELKFSSTLLRQRLDFDIMIPAVNVNTSSYDLSVNVFGGHIFGKGDMQLAIRKPRVKGHIILSVRISTNGLFLTIQQCSISISLASFEPVITGLFNDKTISDFVAAFLRNLISELFDFFEEDITDIISTIVRVVGNLILADLDLGDLLRPLSLSTPRDMPARLDPSSSR